MARLLQIAGRPVSLTGSELTGDLDALVAGRRITIREAPRITRTDAAVPPSVAAQLGVSRNMVSKWRSRFLRDRLEGLSDEPRPGRPRTVTDEQVELVITKTLEEQGPGEDTHWSTRSMAAATGCRRRRCRGSGGRSGSSRTWSRPGS